MRRLNILSRWRERESDKRSCTICAPLGVRTYVGIYGRRLRHDFQCRTSPSPGSPDRDHPEVLGMNSGAAIDRWFRRKQFKLCRWTPTARDQAVLAEHDSMDGFATHCHNSWPTFLFMVQQLSPIRGRPADPRGQRIKITCLHRWQTHAQSVAHGPFPLRTCFRRPRPRLSMSDIAV